MSLLAIALAGAASGDVSTQAWPEPPTTQSIEVAIPSLDTGRGIDAGYERWFPSVRLALEARIELREAASGDYTGLRVGLGIEAKWFWRAPQGAWLSKLPANNPVGWFLGLGYYAAGDFTHDDKDHRWLGSAAELGAVARIGYRIAPWRQLTITPTAGGEIQRDVDLSGRLTGVFRLGGSYGLDVGWMF